MPEVDTGKAVRVPDLTLEFFADDDHWTRGGNDDDRGRRCPVGAVLNLARKHGLPSGQGR